MVKIAAWHFWTVSRPTEKLFRRLQIFTSRRGLGFLLFGARPGRAEAREVLFREVLFQGTEYFRAEISP
tara:strand:- start:319 stop:525 length:207 start_codon:yes stop_codon:yes gene_type:complete